MLPTPFLFSPKHRSARSITQDVILFLNNLFLQYTNPLPFDTEAHSIHTIPLLREYLDSYLYYFRYKTLELTPSQQPSQIIFNPLQRINSGTYLGTIQPSHITRDTTESNQDTLINTHNTSTITDSNALQAPTHDIAENTNKFFNQEDPSTLSTINTIDTQPLQTHHRQTYDPPPPPSENSTQYSHTFTSTRFI